MKKEQYEKYNETKVIGSRYTKSEKHMRRGSRETRRKED